MCHARQWAEQSQAVVHSHEINRLQHCMEWVCSYTLAELTPDSVVTFIYSTPHTLWGCAGELASALDPGWCRCYPHRLRNDLKCVEWDVKPCSTNHQLFSNASITWRAYFESRDTTHALLHAPFSRWIACDSPRADTAGINSAPMRGFLLLQFLHHTTYVRLLWHGWVDGWMDGWTIGWMNKWMNK